MRLVVTGAAGLLGRHVAAAAEAAGHRVLGIDSAPQVHGGWERVSADLTDLGLAAQLFEGAEVIANCAAIPRPTGRAAAEIFRINMATIYAATEAARLAGAGLFIQASSFSVLGYPFAPVLPVPQAVPVSEAQPAAPQDIYGLTKWLAEEMVEAAVRRGDFRAISLRMPWIQTPESFAAEIGPRRLTAGAAADLWAYLDARDAAAAFVAAIGWRGTGHLRCFISAADSYSEEPSAELVAGAFGPAMPGSERLSGHESLISSDLAAEELGFAPRYSWRDYGMEAGT